jgi:hypothetical protein
MKLYLKNNLKQKGLEACLKGWSSNPSTAKKKKKKKKESIFRLRQQPSYPFRAALCAGARKKQSQNHLQLCSQFRTQVSPSPEGLLSGSLCKVLRVP